MVSSVILVGRQERAPKFAQSLGNGMDKKKIKEYERNLTGMVLKVPFHSASESNFLTLSRAKRFRSVFLPRTA